MTKESKLYKKQRFLIEALQQFEPNEIDNLRNIIDYFYKKLEHKDLTND